MHVREEKAPERELVDGKRNDAAALPVAKRGHGQMAQRKRDLLEELYYTIKIAEHGRQIATQQSNWQAADETINNGEGSSESQGEERWDGKIERGGGDNAGQLDQR